MSDRLTWVREARRILCVQPHYDDNDLGMGGTVAALADAGAEIHYLTATDDLVGVLDPDLPDAEATRRLRAEQHAAGALLGVAGQHWLELPDAGPYDYYTLRNGIIRHIRMLRPDVVFSVDPWLPFETHSDHLRVGRATAEACMLHKHTRLKIDPEIEAAWKPHEVVAVGFYFTTEPNACFDVTASRSKKHEAIGVYRTQLTEADISGLRAGLSGIEQRWAADETFSHGEALRVLSPSALHVNLLPELLHCFASHLVDLRGWQAPIARVVAKAPRASALARHQVASSPSVTTQLHAAVHLDPFATQLIPLLDGTRTHAELASTLAQLAEDRVLQVDTDGEPVTDRERLESVMREVLGKVLPQMRSQALLEA